MVCPVRIAAIAGIRGPCAHWLAAEAGAGAAGAVDGVVDGAVAGLPPMPGLAGGAALSRLQPASSNAANVNARPVVRKGWLFDLSLVP
jgi:hypothetical protein